MKRSANDAPGAMVKPVTNMFLVTDAPPATAPEGKLTLAEKESAGRGIETPLITRAASKVSTRPPKAARHCSAVNDT